MSDGPIHTKTKESCQYVGFHACGWKWEMMSEHLWESIQGNDGTSDMIQLVFTNSCL